MPDVARLTEIQKPETLSAEVSAATAQRLAGMIERANGAQEAAKAAVATAQRMIDEFQQTAGVLFEASSGGKLPDGNWNVELDTVGRRIVLTKQGPGA